MPKISGYPKVRYNLYTKKGGGTYINLFYHYHMGRLKMATGAMVNPRYWNKRTQRATMDGSNPNAHIKLNEFLDNLANTVDNIYRETNGGKIALDNFKLEIQYRMNMKPRPDAETDATRKALPLFEFIPAFIEERKAQPRGTWKIFVTVFGLLKDYANERKGGKLDYAGIDYPFFSDFKTWLFAAPRLHSISYAAKVVDVLKQFMREAGRRGYHEKTDYQGFSIKKIRTPKVALSFEELETLYRLDLSDNKRLEKVRDLFLIGAYTGLRFSDFTRIKPEHVEHVDGHDILTITTQKTGEVVSIPLMPIPLALLKKYHFQTPEISNQKMNEYLKELGQVAGMNDKMIVTTTQGGKRKEVKAEKWEKLTTHVARRSFATNFYRLGFPASQLMKITGHTTERQFSEYTQIDAKTNALDLANTMKEKTTLRRIV